MDQIYISIHYFFAHGLVIFVMLSIVIDGYRPTLYDYFDAKNVLDFSMGWGDRLSGFFASMNTELYVGIDPRKENHDIYEKQASYYQSQLGFFEKDKEWEFHCEAAEDFDFDQYSDTFDIIFPRSRASRGRLYDVLGLQLNCFLKDFLEGGVGGH